MFDANDKSQVTALSESIAQAVADAKVGFHFEEGGCWGFAAALYDLLRQSNVICSLRYSPEGFVHAWVTIGRTGWDQSGLMNESVKGKGLHMPRANAADIAKAYGVDAESFNSDYAEAEGILNNAAALFIEKTRD